MVARELERHAPDAVLPVRAAALRNGGGSEEQAAQPGASQIALGPLPAAQAAALLGRAVGGPMTLAEVMAAAPSR